MAQAAWLTADGACAALRTLEPIRNVAVTIRRLPYEPCYPLLVLRAALLVTVMCLSFEMSGLAAVCGDPIGAEDCDGSGGECPPNCHSCVCCSFPKTIVSSSSVSIPQRHVVTGAWLVGADAPASTDPADIFHVPKLLLA